MPINCDTQLGPCERRGKTLGRDRHRLGCQDVLRATVPGGGDTLPSPTGAGGWGRGRAAARGFGRRVSDPWGDPSARHHPGQLLPSACPASGCPEPRGASERREGPGAGRGGGGLQAERRGRRPRFHGEGRAGGRFLPLRRQAAAVAGSGTRSSSRSRRRHRANL